MKNRINKIFKYFLFIILSFFLISILSKSTSPFYSKTYSIDSSIFQVIGKGILNGYIPYSQLFDHKGPILFFIEAFGFFINKNYGIYILQIINCFISIIFLEKIINLFEKNIIKKIIILEITLIFYALFFSEGNLSEEWSLSFILITFYLNLKSILKGEYNRTVYRCFWNMFFYYFVN